MGELLSGCVDGLGVLGQTWGARQELGAVLMEDQV